MLLSRMSEAACSRSVSPIPGRGSGRPVEAVDEAMKYRIPFSGCDQGRWWPRMPEAFCEHRRQPSACGATKAANARSCGLALVHGLVWAKRADPRLHHYFQVPLSHCFQVPLSHWVLMQSSHVIGFLLLAAPRALTRRYLSAAYYFQVPLSHWVLIQSSHVIGFLLVSLKQIATTSHRGLGTRCLAALIPRHRVPPPRASSAFLAEGRGNSHPLRPSIFMKRTQ